MTKYYTGVGSRETPLHVYELMEDIAFKLEQRGFVLRSGGAPGADQAFENGWWSSYIDNMKEVASAEIFLPWEGFEGKWSGAGDGAYRVVKDIDKAMDMASKIHPAWDAVKKDGTPVLKRGAKGMHARNCFQVLGGDLETPSEFLICYAPPLPDGTVKGGTRTAWVLAKQNNIPCINLHNSAEFERWSEWVRKK